MPNDKGDSDQKLKKDQTALAMENNPCGLCRFKSPVCKGHAPSGGGGSGGVGGGGELTIINASEATNVSDLFYITRADNGTTKILDSNGNTLTSKDKELESKILLAYVQTLFKQELEIKSDIKNLTFTMQIKAGLPEDQKRLMEEFLESIKDQCDKFMSKKGFGKEDYIAELDMKNGQLKIHIPDKVYYQQFVDEVGKNSSLLLQTKDKLEQAKQYQKLGEPVSSQQEKSESRLGKTPTPYSTRLERK